MYGSSFAVVALLAGGYRNSYREAQATFARFNDPLTGVPIPELQNATLSTAYFAAYQVAQADVALWGGRYRRAVAGAGLLYVWVVLDAVLFHPGGGIASAQPGPARAALAEKSGWDVDLGGAREGVRVTYRFRW